MFQAETVSGLWRANSGFCAMVLTEVQRAAPRISSAPVSKRRPSPFAKRDDADAGKGEERASPGKPRKPLAEKRHGKDRRQDRADIDDEARRARRNGQLAEIEQRRVERDKADAADAEAPSFAARRQGRARDGEKDRGRNGGDGEADSAELQRAEGGQPGADRGKGRRPGEDRDDDGAHGDRVRLSVKLPGW